MSSRENSIRLMDLSLTSTGQYKCEVSTEGPAFATSFKTGNFTVICKFPYFFITILN